MKIFLSIFTAIGLFLMACEPMVDTRPDIGPKPTVDQLGIEITPGSDPYHWIIKNTSAVTGIAHWDLGNGQKVDGDQVTVHYPDAEKYTIKLTLVTKGGTAVKSVDHVQEVPDPVAGNLVKGGKFLTAADSSQWTIQKINNEDAKWQLHGGFAYIDNVPGSWGQAAIYQPIQVVANQKYKIDLYFKTKGATGGWFKVYACTTKPTQMVEYKGDILVSEIGIWKDWNVSSGPVEGMFSAIHTSSGLNSNIVSFPKSGTIYLQIQCGANDLEGGVWCTNVEFRGYNP